MTSMRYVAYCRTCDERLVTADTEAAADERAQAHREAHNFVHAVSVGPDAPTDGTTVGDPVHTRDGWEAH